MTQPPNGPHGSGDNPDNSRWGQGPDSQPNQPGWGGQSPSEPTWGGQTGSEPTWAGSAGAGPDWGQTQPPQNQPPHNQPPPYEPTAEYRPDQYGTGYGTGYGANTPPPSGPGGVGPAGYGPPPNGPKPPSKTPWIIGIAAAAVVVVVLAVVLFVTLGSDDSDPKADPDVPVTTSQSSQAEAEEQIEDAIRTYTVAFSDADWETALAVTCGAEQDIIRDLQSDSSVELNDMQLNSVTGIVVEGDGAEATVSLTYVDPADQSPVKTSRFTFTMENRLETWKICDTREI
jgi:hypothetical protein